MNDTNELAIEAMSALTENGFSVTVRKVKNGYFAECHDFDPEENRNIYGKGITWQEAVIDAGKVFATS